MRAPPLALRPKPPTGDGHAHVLKPLAACMAGQGYARMCCRMPPVAFVPGGAHRGWGVGGGAPFAPGRVGTGGTARALGRSLGACSWPGSLGFRV